MKLDHEGYFVVSFFIGLGDFVISVSREFFLFCLNLRYKPNGHGHAGSSSAAHSSLHVLHYSN